MEQIKRVLQTNVGLMHKWEKEKNKLFRSRPELQLRGSLRAVPWILETGVWNDAGIWTGGGVWQSI